MIYPAHIRCGVGDGPSVQTVAEHCRQCAQRAAAAAPAGMQQAAYLAGLLHDLGKCTRAFSDYITRAAAGEAVRRGSVNHTFAGVRFVLERWHSDVGQSHRNMVSELIACAIGAHHGLFDCLAPDGADGFLHRAAKEGVDYEEAKAGFLASCADLAELDRLFALASEEIAALWDRCRPLAGDSVEGIFYLGLLSRLLLSTVLEGDRGDTAQFMYALPARPTAPVAWADVLAAVEGRLAALPADSAINRARREISDLCREAVHRGPGIFRLNVPTGSGKTLAALRYAVAAAGDGKRRIVFVTPLLSVLEQNAAVIRQYIGDDNLILEHHSNLVQEESGSGEPDGGELLLENWQAPVIITTLVQLLNTLFSGRSSCARRMAALCESVIVIDEIQSLPRHMLSQFNLAMNLLSGVCGATVVLCSATQPYLEKARHPMRCAQRPDLVPHDQTLWQAFRRTEVIDLCMAENGGFQSYSADELADFAAARAAERGSLLLVCNTKAEARMIFLSIRSRWRDALFHLSTAMCMEHRVETLGRINALLDSGAPVICVSTQLVEAGVDFSFGCVIRILAGLDNIVQAAGRCNRSGERGELCPVYIVRLTGENLSRLKEIQQAQEAAQSLLLRFHRDHEAFQCDLTGDDAVRAYYQTLYDAMPADGQDYPLLKDRTTLVDLLSVNRGARAHCPTQNRYTLAQAFRTAGERFHVFEDNTTDVLAPYGRGADLIADLCSARAERDLPYRAALIHRANRFSVSLYDYQLQQLREPGGLFSLCGNSILALRPGYYSDILGLSLNETADHFQEV